MALLRTGSKSERGLVRQRSGDSGDAILHVLEVEGVTLWFCTISLQQVLLHRARFKASKMLPLIIAKWLDEKSLASITTHKL